jgi:hypothetical protein
MCKPGTTSLFSGSMSEGFIYLQASIRCLAPFGSLLEIGKFDMVVGSMLPMRAMLRGINYQAIHLEQVLVEGPNVDTSQV